MTTTNTSKIEKACRLGDKTFDYILKNIKIGETEKQIAYKVRKFIRKNNGRISFRPIIAFGKNSANIHNIPTDNKLKKNQIILLDFGIKLNGYCSDMTRVVFSGKPTTKQKRIYQTVLKAQEKSLEILNTKYLMHKNISAREVDKVARDYIISKGYKTIPHGVGHGIGKKVHEGFHISPKSKKILRSGMVFSIEPGIYIPNFGGIRIEDLIVLTKNGPKLLTHSPKTLIAL
jgi:Xaa-Pro aminopeptidase